MRKIYYCKSLPAVVGDEDALEVLHVAFGFYLIGRRCDFRGEPLDYMDEWKMSEVPASWIESGFMEDVVKLGWISPDIDIVEVNNAELIKKAELVYRMRMCARSVTLLKLVAIAVLVMYAGARMWQMAVGLVS